MSPFFLTFFIFFSTQSQTICRGPNSCDNDMISDDDDIICHGLESCQGSDVTSTAHTVSCLGEYSCNDANIYAADSIYCNGDNACSDSQGNINASKVYCDGNLGCKGVQTTIFGDKRIFCRGYQSCYEAQKLSSNKDIYCTNYESCSGVIDKIEAGRSIYSRGYYSTANTVIEFGSDLYCNSDYSCTNSEISSSQGTAHFLGAFSGARSNIETYDVTCEAPQSCEYSNIVAENELKAFGVAGAWYSNITAKAVYGTGYASLQKSVISSPINEDLRVDLYGYEAGVDLIINCVPPSNCIINCEYGGCHKTIVKYDNVTNNLVINPSDCFDNANAKNPDGHYCPKIRII